LSEEERTHTDVSSLAEVSAASRAPKQHPLPWVLFGVASLLLALIGGLLAKRLNQETKHANEEAQRSATLETQLRAAEAGRSDAEKKVAEAVAAKDDAEKAAAELGDRVKQLEAGKATASTEKNGDAPVVSKGGKKPAKKKKKHH
jgi:hypothetical protein